jgi:hypothetical protein
MIKGNGLPQGIHHNMTILALGDMAVYLLAKFFAERSIHIIG